MFRDGDFRRPLVGFLVPKDRVRQFQLAHYTLVEDESYSENLILILDTADLSLLKDFSNSTSA